MINIEEELNSLVICLETAIKQQQIAEGESSLFIRGMQNQTEYTKALIKGILKKIV